MLRQLALVAGASLVIWRGAFGIQPAEAGPVAAKDPLAGKAKGESPSPKVSTAGTTRKIEFPGPFSFGGLYKESGPYSQPQRIFLGQARGRVAVPAGTRLGLIASYDLLNNIEAIKKIPSDTLSSISLGRIDSESGAPFNIGAIGSQLELKYFDDMETDITDGSVAAFKQMEQLRGLRLWYCGITGSTFDALSGIKTLELLDISLNKICPAGWQAIGKMTHLKSLSIGSAGADDSAMVEVAKLAALEALSMSGNQGVTKKGLALLKNCKKLRILDVSRCNFSANDIVSLAGMKLTNLLISGRHISKPELARIKAAFPGTSIENKDAEDKNTNYLFSPLRF